MLDSYNRNINYLRISVTDRCNLRCKYCMPEEGVKLFKHEDLLSYEEIFEITKVAIKYGINKVRITGGEPLVRKGILNLVAMLASLREIKDLAMTTNGILLTKYAKTLKAAGLHRLNISLDAISPERYKEITRGGEIKDALLGIAAAKDAFQTNIKINCVIENSSNESDAKEVAAFALENGFEIRFIRRMDLSSGNFWVVEGGDGGNCLNCNRLRLTSDGKIVPCLFSNMSFDVKLLGAEEAIKQAVQIKPESGKVSSQNKFYSIGG